MPETRRHVPMHLARTSSASARRHCLRPKAVGRSMGGGGTLAASLITGADTMSGAIATSPGHFGFGPQVAFSYDSGCGNGHFGFVISVATALLNCSIGPMTVQPPSNPSRLPNQDGHVCQCALRVSSRHAPSPPPARTHIALSQRTGPLSVTTLSDDVGECQCHRLRMGATFPKGRCPRRWISYPCRPLEPPWSARDLAVLRHSGNHRNLVYSYGMTDRRERGSHRK